eukprot:jgi/Mesvir1/10963/Mv07850-RA.1
MQTTVCNTPSAFKSSFLSGFVASRPAATHGRIHLPLFRNVARAARPCRLLRPVHCPVQCNAGAGSSWGGPVGGSSAPNDEGNRARPNLPPPQAIAAERVEVANSSPAQTEFWLRPEPKYGASQTLQGEIDRLTRLLAWLKSTSSIAEATACLDACDVVHEFFYGTDEGRKVLSAFPSLDLEDQFYVKATVAAGQQHVLHPDMDATGSYLPELLKLLPKLRRLERFYDAIGGIIGYQLMVLRLVRDKEEAEARMRESGPRPVDSPCTDGHVCLHNPAGIDLAREPEKQPMAAAWGLQALPAMGEVYPLGGAGDRLGLVCELTGQPLPVALLPYCGRTLLEGMVRDLQSREYLYYKVEGAQVRTPVAIMTSEAKNNDAHIRALLRRLRYMGRGRDGFRLFSQPLVPVVGADDGRWMVEEPLKPILKPGGHGVIWKLAQDEGVLDWLEQQGRKAVVVRQISNPMANVDATLLALSGVGHRGKKLFGFASCDRNVGNAEGMNVVMERRFQDARCPGGVRYEYGVSNIEYTELAHFGIEDQPREPGSDISRYPANTNVLYVDLAAVRSVLQSASGSLSPLSEGGVGNDDPPCNCPGKTASVPDVNDQDRAARGILPGMILNLTKAVRYRDHKGREHVVRGGRLECTMQNLADMLMQSFPQPLPKDKHGDLDTFVVYNDRRKVTSSAKKKYTRGQSLHQTPFGSFRDLQLNAAELLQRCGYQVPEMPPTADYLERGPPFIALYHPALGPLWSVIAQKLRGGRLAEGSELLLEIAEVDSQNVTVDGSLLVRASCVMGEMLGDKEPQLVYSERCGRCRLHNVTVRNRGVDWQDASNVYWQHKVVRAESCEVILEQDAEFEARDVTIEGNHMFCVPAGHRMVLSADTSMESGFRVELTPLDGKPTWHWKYTMAPSGDIQLQVVQ